MDEINKLKTAKTNFEVFLKSKDRDYRFMTGLKNFLKDTNDILQAIYDESCQTPAGERWLKGQLQLKPVVNHFFQIHFNRADDPSSLEIFKSSNPKKIILHCKKYLRELETIIESGKGRYITG
jgi:hypothetical protein